MSLNLDIDVLLSPPLYWPNICEYSSDNLAMNTASGTEGSFHLLPWALHLYVRAEIDLGMYLTALALGASRAQPIEDDTWVPA